MYSKSRKAPFTFFISLLGSLHALEEDLITDYYYFFSVMMTVDDKLVLVVSLIQSINDDCT